MIKLKPVVIGIKEAAKWLTKHPRVEGAMIFVGEKLINGLSVPKDEKADLRSRVNNLEEEVEVLKKELTKLKKQQVISYIIIGAFAIVSVLALCLK